MSNQNPRRDDIDWKFPEEDQIDTINDDAFATTLRHACIIFCVVVFIYGVFS